MKWMAGTKRTFLLTCLMLLCCGPLHAGIPTVRGIYITESTMEDTSYLKYLARNARESGINTFVIDMDIPSSRYRNNLSIVRDNGLHYVARIVVFPGGGTPERINSIPYREKKLRLIQTAIAYGANAIQLDYIRYNTSNGASSKHTQDVNNVIRWFRERIPANIPLQVDVFGITSFGEEKHIGQNPVLIAKSANVICPMNYPSHFQPFAWHSARPHETMLNALTAMKDLFLEKEKTIPVKIIPWIETSNYHYAYSSATKQRYIRAQIQAVEDARVDGWYAWSPSNQYDNLFRTLQNWSWVRPANPVPLAGLKQDYCPGPAMFPSAFQT